jgi:hypothetical protein
VHSQKAGGGNDFLRIAGAEQGLGMSYPSFKKCRVQRLTDYAWYR